MRVNPKGAGDAQGVRANPEGRTGKTVKPRMSGRKRREGWLLLVCALVPPLGVAYMWAMQRYAVRARVLVSVLAGLLLFAECYALFSDTAGQPGAMTFVPGAGSIYAPASVTAEPTEEPGATPLPYDVVQAPTADPGAGVPGGEPQATVDPGAFVPNAPVTLDEPFQAYATDAVGGAGTTGGDPNAAQVYTSADSLFYHASSTCGDKQYDVGLTLDQAREQGLAPCNNCNPPAAN